MKAFAAATATLLSLAVGLSEPAQASDDLVEVMLKDRLDEARGYCLDIAGGKGKRAPLDKGLQAHTCYNYTGGILEDQGFDPALIEKGQFKIPYFNVCMAVPAVEAGAAIVLEPCSDAETQKFTLESSGKLVAQSNANLCITVNSTEKREGRGGTPIHVMRPLTLEPCDQAKKAYQTWSLNRP